MIIDLTYPISELGSRYPTDPAPKITVVTARIEGEKLYSGYTELQIRSHHGTHIDAPAHKIPGGKTIDQYEISKFINRAILIDLTVVLEVGESYAQCVSMPLLGRYPLITILDHMQREGVSALLFRTGYDKMIELGRTGSYDFPYIDVRVAESLIKECEQWGIKLNLVGLDSFSVDPKGTPDSPAHRAFLSRDILILETLVHLDEVVALRPFELICAPILYQGADAAQVRAFAKSSTL